MAKNYRYLTFDERLFIESRYENNHSPTEIASDLGVSTSTIYHELKRGYTGWPDKNMRNEYSARLAQQIFMENLKRRGKRKKGVD